jgi:hypothetical protein
MTKYDCTNRSAGEEISGQYQGRILTIVESELVHPSHTDGFVDDGDPVIHGDSCVGIALGSAAAATDLIAVDTEGIRVLTATATDESGNSSIVYGDEIFINTTTAILSKNRNKATQKRFGYALSGLATGTTDVIAVKVHGVPDEPYTIIGTSAAFQAMGTRANANQEYRRSTATSGDVRGEYMALALAGIGASGEAGRFRTIVEAVGVATAHGSHSGLEFDADGTLTGLGVGGRATLIAPDRAAFATLAGGMSELYAAGDSTDFGAATMHSIHRFAMDGDATGKATADNVFEFVGLSATQYAANTDTADHALRVVINGDIRYIMVSEAQS